MKIVFMGTPEFAVASLRTLYECGQDVALAVTQPVNTINVYDILKYDKMIIAKDALAKLEEVYA